MTLRPDQWMDVRRFRALYEAGASISAIARETGRDWKTVKKYVSQDGPSKPPRAPSRRGSRPRMVDQFADVIDAWLRADITLKAAVIHERLVAEYGFTGHYQRVKLYVHESRPRIRGELGIEPYVSLHRRFEVVAGAQAQVDWGDEGEILTHAGVERVYSFHMVLSYSRDPFTCFTTSMDLGVFWDCHRRAFAHFAGVPATIVYDRTKTVVRRHVAPGRAVPLHPEAVAFAGHYGFDIDVLAAYRPTGKGRVERQVDIVREHVLAGRRFDTVAELDEAFSAWLVIRRRQVHRTHGQVIGVRAMADQAALRPLPPVPYLVSDRHLRRVGKDCLVSFAASLYSVPARLVAPGEQVEVRVTPQTVTICRVGATGTAGDVLATHPRAVRRGSWVVDKAHWDGLPTGAGRRVTASHEPFDAPAPPAPAAHGEMNPLEALITRAAAARVAVGRRPLSTYDALAGLQDVTF